MLALLVILAFQTPVWTVSPSGVTVGDTVRVTRRIVADPDVRPSAPPLARSTAVEPLAPPVVAYSEGAVVIRYTLAFFETGRLVVAMPDIELLHANGTVEFISGDSVRVDIRTVLPSGDSLPAPIGFVSPIAIETRTITPLIILLAMTLLFLGIWVYQRSRIQPRPGWESATVDATELPIMEWIRAGESRAVVSALADRLRLAVEVALPDATRGLSTDKCIEVIRQSDLAGPGREVEDLLRSLDRARFAPAVPTDVALLVEQVDDVVALLSDQEIEESE